MSTWRYEADRAKRAALAVASAAFTTAACGGTPAGPAEPVVVFVETNGGGSVVVPSRDLECRSLCVIEALPGETIKVIAAPDSGNEFLGWSQHCTTATCELVADDGVRTAAVFRDPGGPDHVWSTTMTMGTQLVGLDAHDAAVTFAGNYFDTVQFGDSSITAPAERSDGFLGRMRSDGEPRWVTRLAGGEESWAWEAASDSAGRTVVFADGRELGLGGSVVSGPLVAGYDTAGANVWADFPRGGNPVATAAKWTSDDTVLLGGVFSGENLSFGDLILPGGTVGDSGFILEYASDGTPLWATTLPSVEHSEVLVERVFINSIQPTGTAGCSWLARIEEV